MRGSDASRARRRLRLGIGLFVLALAVPSLLLVRKAFDQIKWEAFRQQQVAAEEFATRVDAALAALIRGEDARPVGDFGFLTSEGERAAGYGRRSPLAELPADGRIPGLVGWFQVGADGRFSTPLLPESRLMPAELGLTDTDLRARQQQSRRIEGVLIGNRLVAREPEPAAEPSADAARSEMLDRNTEREYLGQKDETRSSVTASLAPAAPAQSASAAEQKAEPRRQRLSQAAFKRLAEESEPETTAVAADESLAHIQESKADTKLAEPARAVMGGALPAPAASPSPMVKGSDRLADKARAEPTSRAKVGMEPIKSVQLFESGIEPYQLGRLNSGHLLIFRSVWQRGERLIQGALIEQGPFLDAFIGRPFADTALARTSDLAAAYRGQVLATFRSQSDRDYEMGTPPLSGTLLYRTRLREPFGGLELVFSVTHLPDPPGAAVIGWMATALAVVLLAGAWLMYRLGLGQIALAAQQQDFVSAVSHELKTPLTSIRLYAEMLRAGFAPEERKAVYYRFIHEESERLSRLIANVLQLARIGRDTLVLEMEPIAVAGLMQMVRERVAAPIERAGFRLEMGCAGPLWVQADADALVQILINLVDNALKFAAGSSDRRLIIDCEPVGNLWLRIKVRDFGPGIPRGQRKRVFELFYRGPEATQRAITGTGIGLALVRRLVEGMSGRVEVVDRDPGAEFRVDLRQVVPRADAGAVSRTDADSSRS